MIDLSELISKVTPSGEPKQRYKEYVIETQAEGKEALPFKQWYELQQKK